MKRIGFDTLSKSSQVKLRDIQGASIANCKTTKVTPVVATAIEQTTECAARHYTTNGASD